MNYIVRFFSNPDLLEEEYEGQLNQITLQFRIKQLETQFITENKHKRILLFRISTILYILINIGYIVNSSIIYTSKDNVIYRSLFILWLIITLFIQAFIKNYEHICTNILIYISSVFNVVLFVNFTKNIFSPKFSVDAVAEFALVAGLTQAIFAISFVLTQSHYLIQAITFFTYFFIIMGTYEAFDNYKLWSHYLLMIFCGYIMRSYEKLLRIQFLKIQKSRQNLEACKRIYDETVPTSIIILEQCQEFEKIYTQHSNKDKIQFTEENKFLRVVYFNQSASLHFQSIEENSILQDLSSIEIIENDTNIADRLINVRLLDQIPKLKIDYQTQQRFSQRNKLDYDIINSQTVVACQRKIGPNKFLYYDVKPVSCLWEGKICVMLILNDTTDRALRIKQLQDLDKYKDNLLATVSHDLKTPLNSLLIIVNVIQQMLKNKKNLNSYEIEEIQKNLEDMISNQQLLFTMVNDLIDYSQLKVQNLRLNFTQFTLSNCIAKIQKMLRRQIELKKLQFIISGLENPIVMYSDEVRLTQILFNLINNAIKFTFQGSITLKIKLFTEKNFNIVQFQVIDTGIGIPNHIQSMLFKAYSTHNLGNCNNQGVGLGLVISKKMVGLLGPREYIEMESQEGTGSIFGFQIYQNAFYKNAKGVDIPYQENSPMHKIPAIQIKSNQYRQSSLPELPKVSQNIQILIVDDTPFNIYSLKLLIKSIISDVQIEEAQSGQQAIIKFKQKKYDIIFMDLIMPGIDGIEATRQIRLIEKTQLQLVTVQVEHRAYIIMLSGMKGQEDIQKSQSAGSDDFLEKPLTLSDLKVTLRKYNYI